MVDIIIHNGTLLTFDPERPEARALAIIGGLISHVGRDDEVLSLAGPETRIFNAKGGTVLPGFIDSHVHLFAGSVEMAYLNLHGVSGMEGLKAMARAYADAHPDDTVIFGVGADYNILGKGKTPTRHDLDQVIGDRPMALYAADHHTVWANTAALDAVDLLHGAEVDHGSTVVMGNDGLASGELLEPGAYGPVLRLTRHGGRDMAGLVTGRDPVPGATPAQREMDKAAIAEGLAYCASQGITGLHNMDGNLYQLELLSELEAEGRLLCRVEIPFHLKGTDPVCRLAEEASHMRDAYQGDRLWCRRVKMFLDGVIESGTALMLEPYPGSETHRGEVVFPQEHFLAACIEADRLGFQISVHAIGDAAVRRTIDAFEAVRKANGKRDSRHRIEHVGILHPEDLPRLAELGIVASVQPGHAPMGHVFSADGVGQYLHDHQTRWICPWQDIRESGARIIFSTDWPVMAVDVMPNLRAAVAPLDLGPGWKDQTQSLYDGLASYTRDNAWVAFDEERAGMLRAGMRADIAVMSDNLFTLEPDDITRARAVVTICDGRVTFMRER